MSIPSFSQLIAGTMTWGTWGKNLNTAEMAALMHTCVDAGISSFDHADIYGDYSTEAAFGEAFRVSKLPRNNIQLISKCGIQMKSAQRNTSVKHYNYDKAYIIASAEQSLKNLQTDYLDLLLLHRPSPLMDVNEIGEAINTLQQSGKILGFGVSNFTTVQTALIQTIGAVHANQVQFSLTHTQPINDGSFNYMQANNIIPMCWSPLGSIFKKHAEVNQTLNTTLSAMCEKYNCTTDVLLLAWILQHPANILPVFGSASVSRINNMMQATNISLELQDWFLLLQSAEGKEVA